MEANRRHDAPGILGDAHRRAAAVENTDGIPPKPADRSRGRRPEVRNPVLGLKSFRALQQIPDEIDLRKLEKWWFLDLLTAGRIGIR